MLMTLARPQAAPLRFIAARLSIPELESIALQPGVMQAFRLTVQYHDAQHPDQVATLIKTQSQQNPTLTLNYRRIDEAPFTLTHSIEIERFREFDAALRKLGFDTLDDPRDVPYYGNDLWLIERAAVSFHHDIIIAPSKATGVYAEIVKLVREKMREATRPINV
jgi:hypothetical protein